jgi:SAM-dependent methyltransferase
VGTRPDGERSQGRTSADQWPGEITGEGEPKALKVLSDALRCAGPVDRATHRFHSYPARLHPDAARRLLTIMQGDVVLDPFCGGGTVMVEGMLAKRTVFGNDLSPVAAEVAWARTRQWDAGQLDALLAAARAVSEEASSRCRRRRAAPIPARVLDLRAWYAPQMLGELGWLLALSQEVTQPDVRRMLRAVHSASVIKFSLRASDTSNQRVDVQRPPGSACRHFVAKTEELCEQLAAFTVLTAAAPPPTITQGDVMKLTLPKPAHAILTSPPYPGTYDYVELQQLRLAWYGWSEEKGKWAEAEIGSRRVFKQPPGEARAQWMAQTKGWMQLASQLLVPGGRLCVVIGDGLIRSKLIDTLQPSLVGAKAAGLRSIAHASAERVDFATGRTRCEHAILWERG